MRHLLKRADFLAARSGRRASFRALSLQAVERGDSDEPRFGFTVTKETGTSTERNRMRRRLREGVRKTAPFAARAGFDYVIFARRDVLALSFDALLAELDRAFSRIHAATPPSNGQRRETQSP